MVRCARRLPAVAVMAAALTGSLVCSRPARAQEPTPEQTLSAFVTTLDAGRPDCSLMIADLRELFVVPQFSGQPLGSPQTWTADNKLALCSAYLAEYNGAWTNPEWLRTVIVSTAVAERTDTVVRLRVRVRHSFRDTRDVRDQLIDVWLQVEDGAWKLASHQQLLQTDDAVAPGSLAQWPAYRGRLERVAAARRAEQQQEIASAQAATMPIGTRPLACGGRASRVRDTARDVDRESTESRLPDQRLPTIDMTAASLHSRAGSLCWQVGFRRPPGPAFRLTITIFQRSLDPSSEEPIGEDLEATVQDGKVLAGVPSRLRDTMEFLPVDMSRTGNVVRLRVDERRLRARRGRANTKRAFFWLLQVSEPSSDGMTQWIDMLPTMGVAHRP